MAAPEFSQIPMSQNLVATLARASDAAHAIGSAEVGLEHVLLSLCHDPDAEAVMTASRIDVARLQAETAQYLGAQPSHPPGARLGVAIDLTRILEAAAAAARGSRRRDINGAIVLAAIVGDGKSVAAQILQAHGLTFDEAIRALQAALAPGARDVVVDNRPAEDVLARARERVQSRSAPTLREIMGEQSRPALPPPPPEPPPVHANHADLSEPMSSAASTTERPSPPPTPGQISAPEPLPAPDTASAASPPAHRYPADLPGPVELARPQPIATPPPIPQPHQPYPARPQGGPPLPYPQQPIDPRGDASWPRAGAVGAPPPGMPPLTPYHPAQPGSAPPPYPSAPMYPQGGPPIGVPQPSARGQSMPSAPAPGPLQVPDSSARKSKPKVETGELAENIPRSMRVGRTERIEVRIAKASVKALTDGLDGGGVAWRHDVTITQAMSVRMRAPEGGFFIETASPETQWIESNLGFASDEYASWRFQVTPQSRGWSRLQIVVSARTIGADGMAAETALPDQIVDVKVKTNYKRTLVRWTGWVLAAIVGGALAKFGEGGLALIEKVLR